ncbi:serine hydrolase domain-containing protein [Sporichthya polymorpha]|uniref:serine hydrolase domain-containing protein n=1 Tax=Sporichthya polymorpha TaxID=35751 RepID=UPI00039B37CD|nr:serine hydrolase [Sporichthya polymorpha]
MRIPRRVPALVLAAGTALALLPPPPADAWSPQCAPDAAGYERAGAAAVGLDADALRDAVDYWVNEGAESLKVFRHGCLVAEGTLDPAVERIPRQNWSQTKTISALVAGVAVRRGVIDVDDPIGKHLPPGIGDAEHRAITVRHILTMTTGLELRPMFAMALNADLIGPQDAMAIRMRHRPGEYFEYDQNAASLLNWVVESALRRAGVAPNFLTFARDEFFTPLGIPADAYVWQTDRAGTPMTHANLHLRPLEFGRIGDLMRRQGLVGDRRLIDAEYLEMLRTGTTANCGYGFMTWLNGCTGNQRQVNASIITRREIRPARSWIASAPADMYYTWGAHGQHVFVIPSLDLVITRAGERSPDNSSDTAKLDENLIWNGSQKAGYEEFFRRLMIAVRAS